MMRILLVAIGLLLATAAWGAINFKSKTINGFQIVGIAVRTNAETEKSSAKKVPGIMAQFFKEGIFAKIPNKADTNLYTVYTDYSNGPKGDFTYLVGAKVRTIGKIPPGLVTRAIPSGNYAVFTSDKGPVLQVLSDEWARAFSMRAKREIQQNYKATFVVYDDGAKNFNNVQVSLYIGIKQALRY